MKNINKNIKKKNNETFAQSSWKRRKMTFPAVPTNRQGIHPFARARIVTLISPPDARESERERSGSTLHGQPRLRARALIAPAVSWMRRRCWHTMRYKSRRAADIHTRACECEKEISFAILITAVRRRFAGLSTHSLCLSHCGSFEWLSLSLSPLLCLSLCLLSPRVSRFRFRVGGNSMTIALPFRVLQASASIRERKILVKSPAAHARVLRVACFSRSSRLAVFFWLGRWAIVDARGRRTSMVRSCCRLSGNYNKAGVCYVRVDGVFLYDLLKIKKKKTFWVLDVVWKIRNFIRS